MDLKQVKKNIERLSNGKKSRFILAVSGGADSVAMLDIFTSMGYDCIIAHCNFHLRGEESNRDEKHVQELAEKYSLPLFIKPFNTVEYAKENSLSIEMAARDLRYGWFEELSKEQNCDCIVVAHHGGDVAETVLINLIRGTGIRGLCGIPERNGKVIRPFLKFTREDILEYLTNNGIEYCEDSTNLETDYVRNRIRHNIIPQMERINPALVHTIVENTDRLREVEALFYSKIDDIKSDIVSYRGDAMYIDIKGLNECIAPSTILFELLKQYNFGSKIVGDIFNSLTSISGKQFYSPTHKLIKDREKLMVYAIEAIDIQKYTIEEGADKIVSPLNMSIESFNAEGFTIPRVSDIACFDAQKLKFPLLLRKWKQGDVFCPFGMKGKKKKVSDFFTDKKFSLREKENTWILESDGKIAWLIGHRVDERFCVTTETGQIIKLSLV